MTTETLWQQCLNQLKSEGSISTEQFNMWLRPLQATFKENSLLLSAPNHFVMDWISEHFLNDIKRLVKDLHGDSSMKVQLTIGASSTVTPLSTNNTEPVSTPTTPEKPSPKPTAPLASPSKLKSTLNSYLNPNFTFQTFIEGEPNKFAKAAAELVGDNPGKIHNPLFIYGDVGLGKTHLMQAIGNRVLETKPQALVLYIHSERFVSDMVKALQRNVIDDFKRYYRSLHVLLIDDIQFFAGKDRSQLEFFHTFNALLDGQQQIVLTSDRYPKELEGLEERLKSRLGWGLNVGIDPPDLETRVAILKNKAEKAHILLSDPVAFFIAEHVKSNVRELEGALKRVVANAHFTGQPISLEFARDTLKDMLALHAKLVTIENIQKVVAQYYKLKPTDLQSKRRVHTIALPRQIAMALAKVLTDKSLTDIGYSFGGRDHTTVIHACRRIKKLIEQDPSAKEDYDTLLRILSN